VPQAVLQAQGSQETDGGAVGGRGGGGGGGDVAWLLEEERVEDLLEAEQARLCEQLMDEEAQPLDCQHKALLRARLMPWCLRTLDACLAHMDAATLFHCEAAMSLASLILAHLPSLPYDWQLGHVLRVRGRRRGQGSKRRPASEPSAPRSAASSPAPWPLQCIERAVAMLNHVPPEASATADSPMCRMMRVCGTPLQPAVPYAAVLVMTASCRACCCQQPPCHGVRVWRIRLWHRLTGGRLQAYRRFAAVLFASLQPAPLLHLQALERLGDLTSHLVALPPIGAALARALLHAWVALPHCIARPRRRCGMLQPS
jgi:hypothetical protein